MRLVIFFLLLSLGADAQIIRANAFYRPTAVSANLLLDNYSAFGAYSLRKLRTLYTGNCIRVRRKSDNTEKDIGFVSNYLDTVDLKSFVGTGSTDTGFVKIFYDQVGSNDFAQNTSSNQPIIIDAGTLVKKDGFCTIKAIASRNSNLVSGTTSTYNFMHNGTTKNALFLVYSKDAAGTNQGIIGNNRQVQNIGFSITAQTTDAIQSQITSAPTTFVAQVTKIASINTLNLISLFNDPSNATLASRMKLYINNIIGSTNTNLSTPTTSNASFALTLFADGFGRPLDGTINEFIIFNSDQESNSVAIQSNINNFYKIFWDGSNQGLLDTYVNAAAAYSLRNLKSTYTGALIKVRRSSDGVELDVNGDYDGNLDTLGLKNFIGANDGFITTWYNQGDSTSIDFTQTTAANQPIIMTAGTIERRYGEPSIRIVNTGSTGTSDFMSIASSTAKFNFLHQAGQSAVFFIFQSGVNSDPNLDMILLDNTGTASANHGYLLRNSDLTPINNRLQSSVFRGVSGASTSTQSIDNYISPDTIILITNLLNNTTATAADRNIIYKNGTNEQKNNIATNAASTSNASFNMRLARVANSTTLNFNGYVSEIIMYPTNQSSNRTGIETNINNYYGIW